MYHCQVCNVNVPRVSSHNKSFIHKSNCLIRTEFDNVQIIANAFRNKIVSYKINPQSLNISPELFLSQITNTVCRLIKDTLSKHKSVKINLELFVSYYLPKN